MNPAEIHHGPATLAADNADSIGIPLFHAAWLFSLGIVVAHYLWLRPSYLLIALLPAAVLCGVSALRAQRIAWLPLALFWCMLGAWCAEMQPQPAPAPELAALSDGLLRTVEGTVTSAGPVRGELQADSTEGSTSEPSQLIDLHLSTVEVVSDSEDSQQPVKGNVRLALRWAAGNQLPSGFRCGDRIRADIRLMLPVVYHDPAAWNRRDYLLEQGITSTASVAADHIQLLSPTRNRGLGCRIAGWQHIASARLMALPATMHSFPSILRLSNDDAIMLSAMITGDRTNLTHSLRTGFERTGSFHMLVVSGLHLGIVATCIFWISRRLRIPQLPSTLITIAASLGYALFTGFATPVQRSLWMVSLYLVGRLIYRERNVLNTIGFASLCLIALNPRSLFESSLQMTVLAVVAIGGVAVPFLEKTIHPYLTAARNLGLVAIDVKLPPREAQFRVTLRMFASALSRAIGRRAGFSVFPWAVHTLLRCIEAAVVSFIVELAMALPMAIYFHRITVFALPVNLIILPLLLVLVPGALLTLSAALISPAIALFPAAITAALLHIGVAFVHLFGSIKTGDFRIPAPLPLQSAAFCILIGSAIVLARFANRAEKQLPRQLAWIAVIAAAVAVVLPRPIDHPHDALLVQAIDVGQGDSLLLVTPEGRTMLVDGGGFGGNPQQPAPDFDIGEEVVSPVLWARGIRHLDVVALSHAHSDHMGGLPAVLSNFRPNELWVGNNPDTPAYDAFLTEARDLHVRIESLRAGDDRKLGDSEVHVLAPLPGYQPGSEPANNDSLVLHVSYRDTSVLLEGDAEGPVEKAMLGEQGLESTLLKIGHHGSVSSTQPEFLARVAPKWAIISCGLRNHYGHPRQEVLAALQASHVRTFSTDINGTTCFALDGRSIRAEAFCGMQ
jgi:competence protein ComEC